MIIIDSLYLIFLFACLVVLSALFIKSVRDHKEFKKQWAELDNKPKEKVIKIKTNISDQPEKYRIVKAHTAENGEKYFIEVYLTVSDEWLTIGTKAYDTYKSALKVKLYLEQSQREKLANSILSKEVVE